MRVALVALLLAAPAALAGCLTSGGDATGNTTFLGVIGIARFDSAWNDHAIRVAFANASYAVTSSSATTMSANGPDGRTAQASVNGTGWQILFYVPGQKASGLSSDEAYNRAQILWTQVEPTLHDDVRTMEIYGGFSHTGVIDHVPWMSTP